MHHPVKSAFETILFRKFSKIFTVRRSISIIEITAARCGQTGGTAHYNALCLFHLPDKLFYLFFIRQRFLIR